MNTKLILAAAATATVFFLPLQGRAQTVLVAQDTASDPVYSSGYSSGQNGGFGFTPFAVTSTGSAGTFVYTASESEGNNGTPSPGSIDTPNPTSGGSPLSFGTYSNSTGSVVTAARGFVTPLAVTGDAFSLDFVKGYNDIGSAGVALTNSSGVLGDFTFTGGGPGIDFNGTSTGIGFNSGADHLVYTITGASTYSLAVTGADTFSGTGTFSSPITGFQIQQTDSGSGSPDHNAYFNNLSETKTASPAPEPAQMAGLSFMALGLGGLLLRRRACAG